MGIFQSLLLNDFTQTLSLGYFHSYAFAADLSEVEFGHGRLGFRDVGHLDKGKAFGLAGGLIHDQRTLSDLTVGGKQSADLRLLGGARETAD